MSDAIQHAVKLAIRAAKQFEGATAPNPIVGAVGLTEEGKILGVAAHTKAGMPHAEEALIRQLHAEGELEYLHTLLVTLEPCTHHGKTPPCIDAILQTNVKRVILGTLDPNPKVHAQGLQSLNQRIETLLLSDFDQKLASQCQQMIKPYAHWIKHRKPWVILKQAYTQEGHMIPPAGQTTFTSHDSLVFAHELRKKSDAILTGSGTIIADFPQFTVRYVPDHPKKTRWLIFFDRRQRVSNAWKERAANQGFLLKAFSDFEKALDFLGEQDVHTALVEAGPSLSSYVHDHDFWDERIEIFQGSQGEKDQIVQSFKKLRKSLPLSPINKKRP